MVLAAREAAARHVVKVAIEPFRPQHEEAAAAFNRRMRNAGAPTAFLLPTRAKPAAAADGVTLTQYVAVDDVGHVRGGILCQEHPALVGGRIERTANLQAPLSEGIMDRAYAFVAPQLVKHVVRRTPHVFVVGMGSAELPFPRMLKAMGWGLHTAPFYYRLLRPSRCVRHLGPLRATRARRLAARVAAATGLAALAGRAAHHPSAETRRIAAGFSAEPVQRWDDWADAAWEVFAEHLSFGVRRTRDALPFFYPFTERSPHAWMLTHRGAVQGWFGLAVRPMTGNAYFGDLTVATLTDCVGTREAVRAGMALAVEQAAAEGADILVTNQQHRLLGESCLAAGWRQGPSNFLVATSPALNKSFDGSTAYVTRRDGDGLTNLA